MTPEMKNQEMENPVTLMAFDEEGAIKLGGELENENNWTIVHGFPSEMELGLNIRERDDEFIKELAHSMLAQGQRQECTGDVLAGGKVRVWAGQHRYLAIGLLNKWIDDHNKLYPDEQRTVRKLRVRAFYREMTDDEVLKVQIAENLHKNMKPEEEAEAISTVYNFYSSVVGEGSSFADFSRKTGFGPDKVRNSVRYEGVDERVKYLVENNALIFSIATNLARVPYEKQLPLAQKIIEFKYSRKAAESLIRSALGEGEEITLFGEEEWFRVVEENYRIAFRSNADKAARDAAGYFERLLRLLDVLDEPERVTLTRTIRDILASFIVSSADFQLRLGGKAPHLLQLLEDRARQMIVEDE